MPPKAGRPVLVESEGPSWKVQLFFVGSLIAAALSTISITSNLDRFNYISSYPSRFSLQSIPDDLLELATFLTPEPLKLLYDNAQTCYRQFTEQDVRLLDLERFLDKEEKYAWDRLLENVHPPGTSKGCVVASPSREKPDYWYSWTRDSALVMKTVIQRFIAGDRKLQSTVDDYIVGVREMQHKNTVIGDFHTGGLGEVKYHVNNEPFSGEWGRPQNDGPALRVITLVEYAHYQLDHGEEKDKRFVKEVLYDGQYPAESVIKGDLEHIAHRWSEPGYDLWEEVQGQHFYTLLAIHSALLHGSSLALRLSDPLAAEFYSTQASLISHRLDEFWSPSKGIIRVSLNHTKGRVSEENARVGDDTYGKGSELDTATLLAVLHSGGGTKWEQNSKVLATLDRLIEAFGPLYPINAGLPTALSSAVGLGRYPEDVYDGIGISQGHPWYLCTLSAAELLYRSSSLLLAQPEPLVITDLSRNWFGRFLPLGLGGKETTLKPGGKEIRKIVDGQRKLADGFVGVVQEFARRNGSLNEQFHRETGVGRGARDLTWSYAAFITAAQARRL